MIREFIFLNTLNNGLNDVWSFASFSNKNKLIKLLPIINPEVNSNFLKEFYQYSSINGYFIPDCIKYELKLLISFYFICRLENNENKIIFINYNIKERFLFKSDVTDQLNKDFVKFSQKVMIKNQMDLNSLCYTTVGMKYLFIKEGDRGLKSIKPNTIPYNSEY